MKFLSSSVLLVVFISLMSCASGYQKIEPNAMSYVSRATDSGVTVEYKYDVLEKKYAKRADKKGIKLVALKVTNESGKDLVFGNDIKLTYENGNELVLMEKDKAFSSLKQGSLGYLFYLLLAPVNLTSSKSENGVVVQDNLFPIGLILGPALAGGNMLIAGEANKKFKQELIDFEIQGTTIKNGETANGLIALKASGYEALKVKVGQ